MIDIKILGTGCGKCRFLESMVYKALELMNVLDASVELVTNQMELEHWLLGDSTPGLIIDGNLFWAGSTPSFEQVERWITERLAEKI